MTKFIKIPFAYSGDKTSVPDATQPSGEVSYNQGYGPYYALDQSTDPLALDIERQKFNQVMFDITSVLRQYQEFSVPDFITSSDNGGTPFTYSKGASVRYDGGSGVDVYVSLIDTNTDLPTVTASWALASAATPDATETVKGKAEIATNSETIAGSDDTRIVTPAKLRYGFAFSFGQNGYIAFPSWLGGLILQWGKSSSLSNDTPTAITLPITFPNAAYVGISSFLGTTFISGNASGVTALSTSQITVMCTTSGKTLGWIAIGY